MKLGQADREQIMQILLFLGLIEEKISYLEQIPVDVYIHIHRHLQHSDIANFSKCSKHTKSFIFGKSSRKYLFPHLEIALNYEEQAFYSYFNSCLKMQTFRQDFILIGSGVYYLKDSKIQIKYDCSNIIGQLQFNKIGNIIQIVNIINIIYALFDDGTIVSKNLLTKEETTTIELKECIFMSVNKQDLIIVIGDGNCFRWNGFLSRIRGPKYIVQAVDHDSNFKLMMTSNGLLYTCNSDYAECHKFSTNNTFSQISGKYLLDRQGIVHEIDLKTWKMKFIKNHERYGKVVGMINNVHYLFLLNREGKVFNYLLTDPVFSNVTNLITLYIGKLYYITENSLKYRDCYRLESSAHHVLTLQ